MHDVNAFERQVADEALRMAGPSEPVDDAAVFTAITTTQSPKWRFGSMFSVTKFVVAGTIVALFGGFLLSGLLTQPSDDRPSAIGASATATTRADPTEATTSEPQPTAEVVAVDTTTSPALLPGVDLSVEEVQPGVFLVTSDGKRDARGRDMTVSAEGDVWLLRGRIGDWSVERLGDSGTSLHLKDGKSRSLSLGVDRDGAPRVESWGEDQGGRAQVFDGTGWTAAEYWDPACPGTDATVSTASAHLTLMPDGSCWGPRRNRFEDDRWRNVPDSELGLAEGQDVDANASGPDGTGWVSVRSSHADGFLVGFDGLLRYDGVTWTKVPYLSPEGTNDHPALTSDLAVAPDGTVWLAELSGGNPGSVTVRRWDGTTWNSYGPIPRPPYPAPLYDPEPRGTHFNADGTIWFMDGWLYFDGETLHPFDLDAVRHLRYERPTSQSAKGFDPRGNIWVLAPDRRLIVITPEAMATAE